MTRAFPNIEKAAFRRGEYIGYGEGLWRIFRWDSEWRAVKQGLAARTITAKNLQGISRQLSERGQS